MSFNTPETKTRQDAKQSSLLPLVRELSLVMADYRRKHEAGLTDLDDLTTQIMTMRLELASAEPQNAVDALVIAGSAAQIVNLLLTRNLEDLGADSIHVCAIELTKALSGLTKYLEAASGTTSDMLGLSLASEGGCWQ